MVSISESFGTTIADIAEPADTANSPNSVTRRAAALTEILPFESRANVTGMKRAYFSFTGRSYVVGYTWR